MKKILLPVLAASLLSLSANAASNKNTASVQNFSPIKSNMMFTIGLGFNPQTEITGFGSETVTHELDNSFTLGIGYQELGIGQMGYSAGLEYTNSSIYTASLTNLSLVGNVNYGINEKVYALGGLNYTNLSTSGLATNATGSGLGFQLGVGFNITEKSTLEIVRKNMIADLTVEGESGNLDTSALELRTQLLF